MCKECEQSFCDTFCPNFSGYVAGVGLPRVTCSSCGSGIYSGELYYLAADNAYCEECVESLDISELADLFGFSKISEIIEILGGELRRD